jgi:hypothetical protein
MICREVNRMQTESKRIVLPEKLQKDMLKFFLRTSIPRKKLSTAARKIEESGGKKND